MLAASAVVCSNEAPLAALRVENPLDGELYLCQRAPTWTSISCAQVLKRKWFVSYGGGKAVVNMRTRMAPRDARRFRFFRATEYAENSGHLDDTCLIGARPSALLAVVFAQMGSRRRKIQRCRSETGMPKPSEVSQEIWRSGVLNN